MFDFSKKYEPKELEEKIIEFWKRNQIFEKALENRERGTLRPPLERGRQVQGEKLKVFRFYEGPPYANGKPGIHHVLTRVFKDIILRYKTMRGYSVPRRAGWDTHGLPIELATEKALGIKSKNEIEKFGIAKFNKKAKELIWSAKDDWEKMTERIAYWLDFKNAYITYENDFIESLWWIFKNISERGYLKKFYKVVPYCARCATPLASHELAQPGVYKKVKDPSLFVKFEIRNPKFETRGREFLLVWTTTPWTLPANVAVAVNTTLTYTKFKITYKNGREEFLWSYNPPPNLEETEIEAFEKISGKKLVGLEYEPPYKTWETKSKTAFRVLPGDFVDTEEGTGLVHIAPSFGEDDFRLIESLDKKLIEEMPTTVDDRGVLMGDLPGSGKFVKEADKDIISDLSDRGFLYHVLQYEHDYPFCWRCNNPLIYFARNSWFFEVSRLRDRLVSLNQQINWFPEHLKEGRFGEWLKEAKDWAISRERYWGTPLPIWECEKCENRKVIGSLDELRAGALEKNKFWMIRHPESDHNVDDWLATGDEKRGSKISKPTKDGLEKAQKLASRLKGKKFDFIYTSPFLRAKKLAEILAETTGAKVIVDERLKEVDCGVFNGKPIEEYRKYFKSELERFSKAPEKAETLHEVRNRVMDFIHDINVRYADKKIIIVSHGDPLWMLDSGLKNLSDEEAIGEARNYPNYGEMKEIGVPSLPLGSDGKLDLHRPYIDEVYLRCSKCKSKMIRVKDVADVWFDSGGMPFASLHYPFENKDLIDGGKFYPADYICEGLDQTRGWFYTLLAVSTLLDKGIPYHNVLTMGLVLDKYGQKMSKSKGNVVEFWEVINKYGVDAIRWYFYTINPPSEPKRFDEVEVQKTHRRFLAILYNSYVFYRTYGVKSKSDSPLNLSGVLDRWIASRTEEAILLITAKIEQYEIGDAAKEIEVLVDDLSRWYIRRSRRRFQKPLNNKDLKDVSSILEFVLLRISIVIAPFVPFFSEALYLSLRGKRESIHLEDWPNVLKKSIDYSLIDAMRGIRRLSSLGLALRATLGIKTRQPLASLIIKDVELKKYYSEEFLEILRDELNVKKILFDPSIQNEIKFDTDISPELKQEGLRRELVRIIQDLRQEANYKPKDEIILGISVGDDLGAVLGNPKMILKEVGARKVEESKKGKWDAQIETKINESDIWLGIRKM